MEDKERYELLKALIPAQLLDKMLAAKGTIEAERRLVTVLFADLASFTAIAERMDPEEVRALTNECLEALVKAVYRYEGFVDKFLGDGVMALFGAPVTHEDDAERALRCALEMEQAIKEVRWSLPQGTTEVLSLHIGVNTGEVIAGPVGSSLRMEYTAVGDTVNLAHRLAEMAKLGEIWVGEPTHQLTRNLFEFEALGGLSVQGRAEPVRTYRLVAAKPKTPRARPLAEGAPLVGRVREKESLLSILEDLARGTGGIVAVIGEPGIGKSRLLLEARQAMEPSRIRWIEVRSLSYSRSLGLQLVKDLLYEILEVNPQEEAHRVRARLRGWTRRMDPKRSEDLYFPLSALLGLGSASQTETLARSRLDIPAPWPGEAQTRYWHTVWALKEMLRYLGQNQPTAIILEDFHWADSPSVELLREVSDVVQLSPLVLIPLFRSDLDSPAWRLVERAARELPDRFQEITLTALSPGETDELARRLLGEERIPLSLLEFLRSATEGNPLFVEEMIRTLVDKAILVRGEDGWVLPKGRPVMEIPEGLRALVSSRLDALPPRAREMLGAAAVIGRTFPHRLLTALLGSADGELEGHLSLLQRESFILEQESAGERAYTFYHALTLEAAYWRLLAAKRREFHRLLAEIYEREIRLAEERNWSLIAHHYTQAQAYERAVDAWLAAAGQAAARGTIEAAQEHYTQVRLLLEGVPGIATQERLWAFHQGVGDAARARGDYQDAQSSYEKLQVLATSPEKRVLAEGLLAQVLYGQGRIQEAFQVVERGIALLREEPLEACLLFRRRAAIYGARGQWDSALEDARHSLRIAESHKGLRETMEACTTLAWVLYYRGDLHSAVEYQEQSLRLSSELGYTEWIAVCYNNLSGYHLVLGNGDKALQYAIQALETVERTGFLYTKAAVLQSLADVHLAQTHWAEARKRFEESLEYFRRLQYPDPALDSHLGLIRALLAEGHTMEALARLEDVEELLPTLVPSILALRAEIYAAAGDLESAEKISKTAVEAAAGSEPERDTTNVYRICGHIFLLQGRLDEAIQWQESALKLLERYPDAGEKARVLLEIGQAYARRNSEDDRSQALQALQQAESVFARLGAEDYIREVKSTLGT